MPYRCRFLTDECGTNSNWYGIQCIDFLLIKLHIASSQDFEQCGEHRLNRLFESILGI
jgi:hypothetical protein